MPTLASLSTTFATRVVTLADGSRGLRSPLHITTREPATDACSPRPLDGRGVRGEGGSSIQQSTNPPILDFIASDETLDRYHEIITATGWKLDNYQRNPVFQNAHQYGDIIFTLGKALVTDVRDARLFQSILFATEANPIARIAYALYKGNFLNAVSVGFVPLRWEDGAAASPFRRKHLEQELLEVSAVGIPANPNALALGLKAGALQKADLQELADLLRTADTPSVQHPESSIHGPPSTVHHQLTQILNLLKRI